MKSNLSIEKSNKKQELSASAKAETVLPAELAARLDLYPENKRRPVNKTLFKNEFFQLTYHVRDYSLDISSRGDIVYSAIPYDTARNYIQRAAIQYLLHPEEVRKYIELHKPTLEKYLMLSIYQVTNQRVNEQSPEVQQAYEAIFQNPLLEIQILGRLLQHDETGPLSANLAGKFLFSENVKTGIAGYIAEYLNFVVQLTQSLPIMTDGKNLQFLGSGQQENRMANKGMQQALTFESDIAPGLNLLPQEVKQSIERSIVPTTQPLPVNNRPLLRSEFGKELSEVRKGYVAHSVHPDELGSYFENVLSTENTNQLNVISDVHATDGKLPFVNRQFNILAGDLSDSHVKDETIKGIYVIGNHDLLDTLPITSDKTDEAWDLWRPFYRKKWFKELVKNPDDSWFLLPTGDHPYYGVVQTELAKRYPKVAVLNNQSLIHDGVRYVGLTIPVALVDRKKAQQQFILHTLQAVLEEDRDIPTILVSHAPLFNELSLLPPKSEAYNKDYTCSEPEIEALFEQYNILGAIHGHHHLPASSGRFKYTEFAGKKLFVVCSIYSKINTGFELMSLMKN
ncbi:hypothetical protein NRIC_25090 [Enterococcus florum]|uniref:Calcineurin-like phosphoesterase domain-containing protein n=1 Tax=Enterococcus florum TaxID=2480627 RepID=A0A4P5PEM3_9ENTE|nr:metallophosphoesterase family protein [Enterococcus florum]GCF94618.1 hypothetical protein NRIC_25090 [Enterococcus florum]